MQRCDKLQIVLVVMISSYSLTLIDVSYVQVTGTKLTNKKSGIKCFLCANRNIYYEQAH